ncbi:MAG: 2-oxo acid dehydrogenase subunit E2 [Sandaracinaceae bacterium]|nr:2-oxo acid dehydrogenase subunit E2 [Sandaracinaceae bacterium]
MSLFEFKLPDIGEGVMEGEIVGWLVTAGQAVREDEPMVEVMTDKATVTIGAPKTGTIRDLHAKVGEVVPVGKVIVTLDLNGSAVAAAPRSVPMPTGPVATGPRATARMETVPVGADPARTVPAPVREAKTIKHAVPPPAAAPAAPSRPAAKPAPTEGPAATAVGDIKETLPGATFFAEPHLEGAAGAPAAPASGHFDPRPLATPATRKLARELGVDLRQVPPTGARGRVTHDDVRAFRSVPAAAATAPPGPSTAPAAARARAPVSIPSEGGALEERKPFVGVRRKIAERMQTSKNTAAHFTFVEECDVGRLKELRARLTPAAAEQGVKLSFLPFIVKAVVAALKKHPILNSALDESTNELVVRRYYHIGIAASTDQGLMVPVVRDADKRSILDIAREIDRLGNAAKEGKIAPADLSGSTFTITSLGKQGGLFATPVLNFPEVGILGVHQIKERPVVRDGQIVIGEIMLLSLSFDHRIVDGHVGAAFAYDVIAYLEEPERLWLEMA